MPVAAAVSMEHARRSFVFVEDIAPFFVSFRNSFSFIEAGQGEEGGDLDRLWRTRRQTTQGRRR